MFNVVTYKFTSKFTEYFITDRDQVTVAELQQNKLFQLNKSTEVCRTETECFVLRCGPTCSYWR